MEVPFNQIFHLEIFRVGDKEFIKISQPITFGGRYRPKITKGNVNAIRRPGIRELVYFSPETIVQKKEPDIPRI